MLRHLLAANAEHRLNAYLVDPNEYRASSASCCKSDEHHRQRLTITVGLNRPTAPKITRVLTLLATN